MSGKSESSTGVMNVIGKVLGPDYLGFSRKHHQRKSKEASNKGAKKISLCIINKKL